MIGPESLKVRKKWNERAKRYDEWYATFKGAVEHYVDWELLKGHLPPKQGCQDLRCCRRHREDNAPFGEDGIPSYSM